MDAHRFCWLLRVIWKCHCLMWHFGFLSRSTWREDLCTKTPKFRMYILINKRQFVLTLHSLIGIVTFHLMIFHSSILTVKKCRQIIEMYGWYIRISFRLIPKITVHWKHGHYVRSSRSISSTSSHKPLYRSSIEPFLRLCLFFIEKNARSIPITFQL